MDTVVILGAGELGATLARRLAGAEQARRIVLVDADEGKARGKALDILESGPVDRFDARLEGAGDATRFGEPDVLVAADAPDLEGRGGPDRLAQVVKALKPGLLVVASARPAAAVEAALEAGMSADRAAGSVPIAVASALQRRLAAILDVEPSAIALALLGLPPDVVVVPHASAVVGGVPIEGLRPNAVRQAVQEVAGRTPGPVALAAAAARLIAALAAPRVSVLPVIARADASSGMARATVALLRRVGGGRIRESIEVALEPYERVRLENAKH